MQTYIAVILDWQRMSRDDRFDVGGVHRAAADAAIQRALAAGHFKAWRVEAEGLNHLFERLNIDHPADYHDRSMSVGDLVLVDGVYHVCRSIGWSVLEPTPTVAVGADA